MMGRAFGSILLVIGVMAWLGSVGSWPCTVASWRCTCESMRSEFALSVNVITTDETPWPDVLVMLSMFCSPETASSMGRVIWSSTSLGLAPARAVVTTTTGTSNLGNRLMGRAKNEATPAATTARTMATMASGLLTAVRVSHIIRLYGL